MCDRPLSIPALMCFFGLLIGASDPARKLSDVFSGIQGGIAAADRLFPVLDRQPRSAIPRNRGPCAAAPAAGLRACLVPYTPGQPILQDINLTVPFGETLCIVGPMGAADHAGQSATAVL